MKHVPFKTALAAFLLAGTTFSPVIADEAASSGPKNPAHVEITLKPGNSRSIGEADLFIPLFQDTMRMFFADFRVVRDTLKNTEGNFGLGYRHIMNNRFILGVYGFFDVRRTRFHHTFYQATFGAEVLTCNFDARVNVYIPTDSKRKHIKRPTYLGAVGNFIGVVSDYRQQFEAALTGFDGEVGAKIPTPGFKNLELKVFGGGYYFFKRHHMHNIAGPRGRVEVRFNDVFTPGSRITVGFEVTNDKRVFKANQSAKRRTHFFGQLGIRIPLQWKSMRVATGLQRRLAEYVYRDVDVVTGVSKGGLLNGSPKKNPTVTNYKRLVKAMTRTTKTTGGAQIAIGSGALNHVYFIDATRAGANGVTNPDGTFERPFASETQAMAYVAASANATPNANGTNVFNYSDVTFAYAGNQTYQVGAQIMQWDNNAQNPLRKSVNVITYGGPEAIQGQLVKVRVKGHGTKAVVSIAPNAVAQNATVVAAVAGANRATLQGTTAGVFGSAGGMNIGWFNVNATAGANNAAVLNIAENAAGNYMIAVNNSNFNGSNAALQGIAIVASNGSNVTSLIDPCQINNFTAANASGLMVNAIGNSALNVTVDNCTLANNATGIIANVGGGNGTDASALNLTTQNNTTIGGAGTPSLVNGVNATVAGNGKGTFNFNQTTVNGTNGAALNPGSGILINNTSGANGQSTTFVGMNGSTVQNANGNGLAIVNNAGVGVGGETGNTTLNVVNSTFAGNGKGTPNGNGLAGHGFAVTLSGGGANSSNAKIGGTISGCTFGGAQAGNQASGLTLDMSSNTANTGLTVTGCTFTNNNTANISGGVGPIYAGAVVGEGYVGEFSVFVNQDQIAAAQQTVTFNNNTLNVANLTNAKGIVLHTLNAANGRLALQASGNAINGSGAGMGILLGGSGGPGNDAPVTDSCVFNVNGGLQVTGFNTAPGAPGVIGAGGWGIVAACNSPSGALNTVGTSVRFTVANGLTFGPGAGQVAITGNATGILVDTHAVGNFQFMNFTGTGAPFTNYPTGIAGGGALAVNPFANNYIFCQGNTANVL